MSRVRWMVLCGVWMAGATAGAQEREPAALPAVPTAAEAVAPFEAAYQREFAYLTAERDALERRLANQQQEARRVLSAAEAEVAQLDARLGALQVRAEGAEALLADVERAAEEALAAEDVVDAAWFQARNSLETLDAVLAELPETPVLADYGRGFTEAFAVGEPTPCGKVQSVRKVPGSWFALDGAETEGQRLLVGNIATFGLTDAGAQALVPQGQGRFQAWREGGGATGDLLAAGGADAAMGLFLHEGRAKRVDERAPKTLSDILEAGGTVGYVILALGVLALFLMALRVWTLAVAGRGAAAVHKVVDAVRRDDLPAALSAATSVPGSAGRVLRAMVPALELPRAALEDVASEALLRETPIIDRFGAAILVIAAVAPLLGLLGTVTGMIATFDIITEFGTGDPRMLSGGISAALVTTQFGLIVAIPALLGGNLLAGWGEGVMGRVEATALAVLNALSARDGDDPDALLPGEDKAVVKPPHLAQVAS